MARENLELHPVLVTGNADLICELVSRNLGISFLPDYVTEHSRRSGLLQILPVKGFDIELWKQVIYRRDKWMSQPLQAIIDHLSSVNLQK